MDIERLATTAVIDRISFCGGLSPFINDGDKEPSWDGNIYVYPNDEKKKAELIAKVLVQVKGKKNNVKKSTHYLNFSAEISDLRNYANDGGIIYFVVAISNDRSKHIFYKSLLPYDLYHILKLARNCKTKSINLRRLPDDDKKIRQIFLSFIADKKRQATQIVLSEEQAVTAVREGATFTFHIQPKDVVKNQQALMREATMQPFYLYVQTKEGIELPFSKIEDNLFKMAKQKIDIPVFVGDVKYYDQFYHGYENGKEYIYIGDVLRISVASDGNPPRKHTLTYTISGSLSKRIMDVDFLLALSKCKNFRIGNYISSEVNMNKQEDVIRLNNMKAELNRIKATLDYFGVKEDLNMDGLTDIDSNNINNLILASECKEIHFKEKELPNLFYYNKKIGNVYIRILAKKKESDDGYRLFNAFIDEAHVRLEAVCHNGERKIIEPWSLFIHMKARDFLCSNIDYDTILNSIRAMKIEDLKISINILETQSISVTNMFLEIIKAYDSQSTKNEQLLQFSINMADILMDEEPESIINKLQAIKRMRPLSNDEIASLVVQRNKMSQNKIINCAVSILLNEDETAKKLLDEMPEKERKLITDYPIYSLI